MTIASNVQQTIATLKGIESQLSTFALQSDEDSAKKEFHESMIIIGEITKDLKERLMKIELEEPQYKGN